MKKVKTLLLSLVIMLASAFISACSCGSTEVTQILETGISLRCVTEEGLITNEVDEYGVIHIEMYRGQKFEIEYTLTPVNVTTTEVGWVYSKGGIVNSGSTNSYSKSKQEKVTFTASGVGETQIEFITAATKKKAVVNVSVYQTIGNLPVFETPSNFVYNASKRELSWKAVTHYTNGEVASKDNSGDIEGLSFYEVKIQEYNDELAPVGEAKVIRTSSNYIPGDEIQTGKRYNVTVTAVGNNQKARSSSESTAFKFIQISENANLANDNGTITFKMPRYSPEAYIYFKGAEDEAAKHRVSATAGSNMSFNYKEIVGETNAKTMTKYNFCVKFYPFGYAENNEGWQGYLENDGNGYRVYESIFSEEIVVHKLATPQVNVKNSTANMSVGKVSDADNSSYSFASNYAQSLISIALPAGAYF